MELTEVLKLLQEGKKLYRPAWRAPMYIIKEDEKISCFIQGAFPYSWDSSILYSGEWIIKDIPETTYQFDETIKLLATGQKMMLKTWKDEYIQVSDRAVIMKKYVPHDFGLSYDDLIASDWEIYNFE